MAHVDFEIVGGKIVYLLRPLKPQAHDCVAKHLPTDALHLGAAVAVEWRYLEDVIGGVVADGLLVR